MNHITMRPGDRFILVRTYGKLYHEWSRYYDVRSFLWVPDEEDVYTWVTGGEKVVAFSNRRLQR